VNLSQLEHIIRAAAGNADKTEIVVIGSQAVLASFPDAPAELTQSMEADVFPKDSPQDALLIDGAIGELSLFHQTFGYYAHGVGADTAVLPRRLEGTPGARTQREHAGRDRLVPGAA
jgi:hypothetical protein